MRNRPCYALHSGAAVVVPRQVPCEAGSVPEARQALRAERSTGGERAVRLPQRRSGVTGRGGAVKGGGGGKIDAHRWKHADERCGPSVLRSRSFDNELLQKKHFSQSCCTCLNK